MQTASEMIRRQLRFGMTTIVLLGGTGMAWGYWATIGSAVVTQGTVVVEGNIKKVQHPTGGVVGQLNVREGQRVTAGEIVVTLDDTMTRTSLGVVMNELTAVRARVARLNAERDSLSRVVFPDDIVARAAKEPGVGAVLAGERQMFMARSSTRNGQKSQLAERVGQLRQEIRGLMEQKVAAETQLKIAREELRPIQSLHKRGLVPVPRLTALEREVARSEGTVGELIAKIAQSQGKITETEFQILQLDKEVGSEVAKELRESETKVGELVEKRTSAEDQLKRVDIRAPITGTVLQLGVHTVGGVVGQTETLMLIVPDTDRLIVEVHINPQDIDQVHVGQSVRARFSAFNQRTTPELDGTLFRVSGDLTREPQTGAAYYVGGISFTEAELKKLDGLKLLPGMPAEGYIKTGTRSPASYLFKPLTDQMHRAMQER
jgi:HlyD family secretion protein